MRRKLLSVLLPPMLLSVSHLSAGQGGGFTARQQTPLPVLRAASQSREELHLAVLPSHLGGKSPEDTIAYDGPNASSFGLGPGGSFYSAVRFTPADSCTVVALTIYLAEQSWTCSLLIWDEGTAVNPGARLQTWTDTSVADAWNRFDLPTPMRRDSAQEFWGGVWLSHAAGEYPVGIDAGPAMAQRSYVSTNGLAWTELPAAGLDNNINDRAIVEYLVQVHDVAPLSIDSPGTGVWKDTSYAVQATVANSGDFTESFDVECIIRDSAMSPVYGDTQWVANLDPAAQTQVSFSNWTPLLYDEVHGMSVATLLSGDDDPDDDTMVQTVQSYEEGEIAYDDFVAEAFYVVSVPSGASDAFAVRFTPYLPPPFHVTKWKIYVYDDTPLDNVRLCPDSAGSPNWNNPYQVFFGPVGVLPPEWLVADFDTLLTRMDTGANLWLGTQFAQNDTGPGIGADSTPPLDGRSFWTSDLTSWNLLPAADFLMRIVHSPITLIHDGEVVSIEGPPDTVFTGFGYEPMATVGNRGNTPETFDVTCTINGYEDTLTVLGLEPDSAVGCTFDLWTVPLTDSTAYLVRMRTRVAGDSDPSNDTLSKSVFAYNPHDVGVDTISSPPDTVNSDSTYAPVGLVGNHGEVPESFEVICAIDGYEDTVSVVDLGPGLAFPCTFSVWTVPPPDSTTYLMNVYTDLSYDRDSSNDTLTKSVFAYRVGVGEELFTVQLPIFSFRLGQNSPNPFAHTTTIPYSLPDAETRGGADLSTYQLINLSVYDLTGRLVRTLADGAQTPGAHSVVWDGRDESGRVLTSGIYFYRLENTEQGGEAGQLVTTKKTVLVR